MHQIIGGVVAAALAGLGFLVRRWLRRESLDEVIARKLKLVTLYQKMKAAGIDRSELQRLEQEISERGD
jgi:hypothetical protein